MDLDAAIRTHEPVAMFIDRDKNKSYKERIRLLVALVKIRTFINNLIID